MTVGLWQPSLKNQSPTEKGPYILAWKSLDRVEGKIKEERTQRIIGKTTAGLFVTEDGERYKLNEPDKGFRKKLCADDTPFLNYLVSLPTLDS